MLGFILTYLFGLGKGQDSAVENNAANQKKDSQTVAAQTKQVTIFSPLNGEVVPLSNIKDAAFASGALGDGVAIEPSEGKLFAPVTGKVTALFPSNHAIGFTTDEGVELLIHIGMDTVELGGKYFTSHVKMDSQVEKGQLLIEFDIQKIRQEGLVLTTPVVVTNHAEYTLAKTSQTQIKSGDQLIELNRK